jgi:hypothetical protein
VTRAIHLQASFLWNAPAAILEVSYLAVLNYQQQGLLMALVKYLVSVLLSVGVCYWTDHNSRRNFLHLKLIDGGIQKQLKL